MKVPGRNMLNVPLSLPQSPRILVESAESPFFHSLHIPHNPSLNFSLPSQAAPVYPMFNSTQTTLKISEPTSKLKGYSLGEFRKNHYGRSSSIDTPQLLKPLQKRPSWEERRNSSQATSDRFQINDVLKENVELLRKYSDPKIQISCHQDTGPSSLSMLQSAFKAKLASLFRNKKKYTIAEPPSSGNESFTMRRCDSCQSLPALTAKKHLKPKHERKERKSLRQMKKSSLDRCRADGKLKSLNLNPPQMIGGSFDNLLLLNRVNQKRAAMGTYDTYHGRPLLSQTSRLKALYKYRKPSESDDATTLSFDYDSGDMSDSSSLERSSSDVGEDSSSFSDLTTKSSTRGYKMRSSASVHSMPQFKTSRKLRKSATAAQSPNRSLDTPQFPINFKSVDPSSANRLAQQSNISNFPKSIPYHLTHQMSAPTLYTRSDYPMMPPMMMQQPSFGQFTKPNYYPSLSMPPANVHASQNPNQMIKAFFTSGPPSSNDFPLVS